MMNFHGYFWIWSLLNIGLLLAWLILGFVALFDLRKRALSGAAKALWTLIVLAIPILGAIALLIVNPTDQPSAGS